MKMPAQFLFAAALTLAGGSAGADEWTLGPAAGVQRWPWSRLVDVTFRVTGVSPGQGAQFGLVVSNGTREVCRKTALQLDQDGVLADGQAHLVWDPEKDIPGQILTGTTFHPYVEAMNDGTYLDIDLTTGEGVYRPASFASEVNADLYKTTHLVLRRVPASTMRDWTGAHAGSDTFVHGGVMSDYTGNKRQMTPHPVRLTEGYYLGVFEFTRAQWEQVSDTPCPAYFEGATRPVESVSYNDLRGRRWPQGGYGDVPAESLMARLRARTGLAFDLPTAAQWEFASRAGSDRNYFASAAEARFWQGGWSETPSADVPPSEGGTGFVGSLLPNDWGFYDILGNVSEWCLDWDGLAGYTDAEQTDPVGFSSATNGCRIYRGGSWWNFSGGSCSANQYCRIPTATDWIIGFRVALPGCVDIRAGLARRAAVAAQDAATPLLRIGVLSDTHVMHAATEADTSRHTDFHLRKALEQFKARRVDAVVIAGDICNTGLLDELRATAAVWDEVFPEGKDDDGRPVEKIFITGNHDVFGDASDTAYLISDKAAQWKAVFGEDYADVFIKDVKGYKFVAAHWGCESARTPAFLEAHRAELAGSKPFFYIQHPHPRDTVFAHWAWGRDDGSTTAALSAFTNAVSISGHSHYPFSDGHAIWQGSFTALCPGSLCYTGLPYGRENGEQNGDSDVKRMDQMSTEGHHAMVFNVFADRIVVERRDVAHDERIDADWTVPLPVTAENMPWTFARQTAREVAPQFPEGAVAKLTWGSGTLRGDSQTRENQFYCEFPAALQSCDPGRVQEYQVDAITRTTVEYVCKTRYVFAPGYFLAPGRIGVPLKCPFSSADIPPGASIRFAVYPVGPFGTRGRPIYSNTSVNWTY